MISRIISKYQPIPATNAKKPNMPPPAFGSVSSQDTVTIAPSPKFGMFRRTSQQSTLTPDQQSALDAARNGRVDILESIYQRTKSYDFLTGADQEQQNILHRAARGNHESIIDYWKKLYDLLPNISNDMYKTWGWKVAGLIRDRDNRQRTPLHWAAMNGHKAIILNLLSAHAPVDDLDEQLQSAADLAENAGHGEIAQILRGKMNKSFTDNVKDSFTNFFQDLADSIPANILDNTNEASTNTTRDTTPSPRPNINSPTPNNDINADLRKLTRGRHSQDNERRVRNLLQQGANPNEQDKQDWRTALHWAAINGHNKYVDLILRYNPDLSLTDKNGDTALALAEKQLNDLKHRRRTPLKGEFERRKQVVNLLKRASRDADLLSSSKGSSVTTPTSSHSPERRGRSRTKSPPRFPNFRDLSRNTIKRLASELKQVARERSISVSPFNSRPSSKERAITENSSSRASSPVSEKIRREVSPLRRKISDLTDKLNTFLEGGLSQLRVKELSANVLNVDQWGSIPPFSSEEVTSESFENLHRRLDELLEAKDFEAEEVKNQAHENRKKEELEKIAAARREKKKGIVNVGKSIVTGGIATILSGGTALPNAIKDVGNTVVSAGSNSETLVNTKIRLSSGGQKIKQEFSKLSGAKDPEKEMGKLAKKLYTAIDNFDFGIKNAKDVHECLKASYRLMNDLTEELANHLIKYGDPEQRKDLRLLRDFANGYEKIATKLRDSAKTEVDLAEFDGDLKALVSNLQESQKLQKLAQTVIEKQALNLINSDYIFSVRDLFGDNPALLHFKQKYNNSCFILAALDCILRHPQAAKILNEIKVRPAEDENGYSVKFPGQAKAVPVTHSEIRNESTVESSFYGPKMFERAYMKLPGVTLRDFEAPWEALQRIFGDGQEHQGIRIESVDAEGRLIHKEEPIQATFNRRKGYYSFEENNEIYPIRVKDMMLADEQKELKRLIKAKSDRPIQLEKIDADHRKTPLYRFYVADLPQKIGKISFPHKDRKAALQDYIRTSLEQYQKDKTLPWDILTAISPKRGRHYYSVRILDSRPDRICIVNPFNTEKTEKIPIDQFLTEYNLEGMALNRNANQSPFSTMQNIIFYYDWGYKQAGTPGGIVGGVIGAFIPTKTTPQNNEFQNNQ